jgi:hypothetical protein
LQSGRSGVFYGLCIPNATLDIPTLGLNEISIKNAKPKGRPYELADGDGMYLLINPDGSRYWRLKYRFKGKERVLALGGLRQRKRQSASKTRASEA